MRLKKINLAVSFSYQNPMDLMRSICGSLKPFSQKLPSIISDGYDEYEETQDWIDKLIPNFQFTVMADWGNKWKGEYNEGFISYNPSEQVVTIKINDFELIDIENIIEIFAPLPWTVANFYDIFDSYENSAWDDYIAPRFADGHGGNGWACAFKGEGHNRLVSRRWLEFGPWRLIRDEANDISFVQFHDLNADSATALEQAKPGHRAMSIHGVAGYIRKTHSFSNDLKGLYVPDDRNMRVVIPAGFEVTESFMTDYCAARNFQAFEGKPIDTLSFVFIDGAEAQNYLHDLWLREIECFGFTPQGVEVRLDEDYHPVPNKPDWVRRLEESEGS